MEHFFGRLKKKFKICRLYRLCHSNFDEDIDNCILLTNLIIKEFELTEEDGEFYRKLLNKRYNEIKEKEQKKKEAKEKWRERTKWTLEQYGLFEM